MDDLLDLFADILDTGDLAPGSIEVGLDADGVGLGMDMDGLDLGGSAEGMPDPLAEGDLFTALHGAEKSPPEETFLGARMIHGDPEGALTSFNQQRFDDSCAVACQSQVLHQLTGRVTDEGLLVEQARQMGWYTPGAGTPLRHTGSLLELHGLQTDNVTGAGIADLKQWLDQGKAVIAGVDAEEILNAGKEQHTLNELLGIPDAGHAVQVTGIQQTSGGETMVVLNDPGHKDGAGMHISAREFLNAWDDTGRFACVVSKG